MSPLLPKCPQIFNCHETFVSNFFQPRQNTALATPVNIFISNHAKILLKKIKDMKIDHQKKPMTIHVSLTTSDQSLLKLFNHHLQWL